jgi:hypothetical protein
VSDWMIWVAMEYSHHDLSIFPRMSGSGTAVKQGTGWYLSHDSVEGATYDIVFLAIQISTAAGVKAQWSTTSKKLLYWYAELPQRVQFIFGQNCFKWRGYLSLVRKVNRHNLIIWGSQNPLQVVEVQRKMDSSWRLHSMATQITQSDTHGLFILGIRERCVHTTHASGPSRASWQDC